MENVSYIHVLNIPDVLLNIGLEELSIIFVGRVIAIYRSAVNLVTLKCECLSINIQAY